MKMTIECPYPVTPITTINTALFALFYVVFLVMCCIKCGADAKNNNWIFKQNSNFQRLKTSTVRTVNQWLTIINFHISRLIAVLRRIPQELHIEETKSINVEFLCEIKGCFISGFIVLTSFQRCSFSLFFGLIDLPRINMTENFPDMLISQ